MQPRGWNRLLFDGQGRPSRKYTGNPHCNSISRTLLRDGLRSQVLWEPDPDAAPPPPGSRSGSRAKSSRASDNFSGSRASRQSTKRSVFSSMSSRAPVFTKIDGFVVGIEITALSEYLAALEEGSFARSVAIAMDEVVSKNDEFCITNEELCIKNEEFCI